MKIRKIKKEQYLEFLEANPTASMKDIAEHFKITKSLVASHFIAYQIKLRDFNLRYFNGVPIEEIVEFAKDHTMKELQNKYNKSVYSVVRRNKIPYIKVHNTCRKRLASGTEYDMMYILSSTYSYASIGKIFGYTREWVRVICDQYESGERILNIKNKEEDDNE